jgi:hypothetical protein
MDQDRLNDIERVIDDHVRRLAQEVGSLLVDLGEALKQATRADVAEQTAPEPPTPLPKRPARG